MGDPRKKKRKYTTPKHPWQAERLESEKRLLEDYSLKNKKEIWRMQFILKKYTNQAKSLVNIKTDQAKKEKEQLINKLFKLGLVKKNAEMDDVLGLSVDDIMNRRLQTLVYKKNMANTPKQARQFIVHGHIFIGDNKMSSPSYLVNADEEIKIKFKDNSSLTGKFGKIEEEKDIKKKEDKPIEKKAKKEKSKDSEKPKKREKPLKESKKKSEEEK